MVSLEKIEEAQKLVNRLQKAITKLNESIKSFQNNISHTGFINEDATLDKEILEVKNLQLSCKEYIASIVGNVDSMNSFEHMKNLIKTYLDLLPIIEEYKVAISRYNNLHSDNENIQKTLESYRIDINTVEWAIDSKEKLNAAYQKYVDFIKLYDITLNGGGDEDLVQKVITGFAVNLITHMSSIKEKSVQDNDNNVNKCLIQDEKILKNENLAKSNSIEVMPSSENKKRLEDDVKKGDKNEPGESGIENIKKAYKKADEKLDELAVVLKLSDSKDNKPFTEKQFKRLSGKNNFVKKGLKFTGYYLLTTLLLDDSIESIDTFLNYDFKVNDALAILDSKGLLCYGEFNGNKFSCLSDKICCSPDYKKIAKHLINNNSITEHFIPDCYTSSKETIFYGLYRLLLTPILGDCDFLYKNIKNHTVYKIYEGINRIANKTIGLKIKNINLIIAQQLIPTEYAEGIDKEVAEEFFTNDATYVLVLSIIDTESFITSHLNNIPNLRGYYQYNILTNKGISFDTKTFEVIKETNSLEDLLHPLIEQKNEMDERILENFMKNISGKSKIDNSLEDLLDEPIEEIVTTVDDNNKIEDTLPIKQDKKDQSVDVLFKEKDDLSSEVTINCSLEGAKNIDNNSDKNLEYDIILSKYRSEDDVNLNLQKMLSNEKMYCAAAYMRAIATMDSKYIALQQLVSYALRDPMYDYVYDSQTVMSLVGINNDLTDYLGISGALRVFFGSQVKYDYSLSALYDMYSNNDILENYGKLKELLFHLYDFKAQYNNGVHSYAVAACQEEDGIHVEIRNLQEKVNTFIKKRLNSKNVTIPRLAETNQLIFSENSELVKMLMLIAKDHVNCKESELNEHKEDVETLLKCYFIDDDVTISPENINQLSVSAYIDDMWKEASKYTKGSRASAKIPKGLRVNLDNHVLEAINLLVTWYCLVDNWDIEQSNLVKDAYIKKRSELMAISNAALKEVSSVDGELINKAGMAVIKYVVKFIRDVITGDYDEFSHKGFYTPFLLNHYVTLAPKDALETNESFTHEIDSLDLDDWKQWVADVRVSTQKVESLYPFYRIEQHAKEDLKSIEQRFDEIFKNEEDDYGTANLLRAYANYKGIDIGDINERSFDASYAKQDADRLKEAFKGNLELSKAYGKLEEDMDKDLVMKRIEDLFIHCSQSNNYHLFKEYIKSVENTIDEKASALKETYITELNQFKNKQNTLSEDQKELIKYIEDMIDNQNYTVAEDFIGALKRGDKVNYALEMEGVDYLERFMDSYDNLCIKADKETSLTKALNIRDHNRDTKHAKELVSAWNFDIGNKVKNIETILTELGFPVKSVKQIDKQIKPGATGYPVYDITLEKPENLRQTMFDHPISSFGSSAMLNGFHVVLMNRRLRASDIMAAIESAGQSKHTIFLVSCSIKLTERKELARKIKEHGVEKVMAIIDRVLITYLALNYKESMIQRMLMSTMLPFSYAQPYIKDSSKLIPPEMFVGRKDELFQIESATGVNIVYGGRQLGKSALLRMAKNNIDYNESGDRAILIDIKNLNSEQTAKKISETLSDEKFFKKEFITSDWGDLSRQIKLRLADENPRIGYFLLLLDEADSFIASESEVNFKAFDCLKDIGQIGPERFKFVVAGLRNIVKFKRKASLGNNSVINHLTSLTVRPLTYLDAKELLEKPLSYLGFRFPKDKQELQPMIFATANYFPGLIQLYCANLVSALTDPDYAGYKQANTPPYLISEDHIKRVLVNEEFTASIKEKFEITLRLDKDDYYYIIALLMAYHYKDNHDETGYTVADMLSLAKEYGVQKIATLDQEKLDALMQEMTELNVLRRSTEGKYLFSRYRFMELMGSKDHIEMEIENYMEDGDV